MCLGIPMQIVEIDGDVGYVESGGVRRKVGLMLIDSPKIGDWVIVHAGFAIEKVDVEDALSTLELIKKGAETMELTGEPQNDRDESSR